MGVESAADRSIFLSASDFGMTGTLVPVGGAAAPITGIFDNEYLLIGESGDTAGLSSATPVFLVRAADLPASGVQGGALSLTIDGAARSYLVAEIKPDGTGMTELRLTRAD